MALYKEQYEYSRASRLGPSWIFRAACDLCGCHSLAWRIASYPNDQFAETFVMGDARDAGWIQRLGGERGNILQAVCPECQDKLRRAA